MQISLTSPSISIAGKSKSSSSSSTSSPSSSSSLSSSSPQGRRYVAIGFAFLALAAAFSIPLFYSSWLNFVKSTWRIRTVSFFLFFPSLPFPSLPLPPFRRLTFYHYPFHTISVYHAHLSHPSVTLVLFVPLGSSRIDVFFFLPSFPSFLPFLPPFISLSYYPPISLPFLTSPPSYLLPLSRLGTEL